MPDFPGPIANQPLPDPMTFPEFFQKATGHRPYPWHRPNIHGEQPIKISEIKGRKTYLTVCLVAQPIDRRKLSLQIGIRPRHVDFVPLQPSLKLPTLHARHRGGLPYAQLAGRIKMRRQPRPHLGIGIGRIVQKLTDSIWETYIHENKMLQFLP